ncbi:phosphoribosyl-AMP cyclohydrolase [archaeon BMS3Abin16]|nr:phosphoribosyl-AMP cyclohydrolase [archaeon BMS3Abin16]
MDSIFDAVNFRIKMGGADVAIAIAQDHATGEVLMVAFMNKEAFEKTVESGTMHYYSTSRRKIWHKGEESGHVQKVKEIRIDCDGDAILFKVEQNSAACHEGYYSCFFRKLDKGEWKFVGDRVFKPEDVY